jgi:tetratricopeptide (TPR) repeat protein/energy-coupling factor transporter ATP-binding protein EcfA2
LTPPGSLFNPFPGLRPFESDEDHLFFGREKQINEILRRLRSARFLAVVGTSGSGKSSLVRSGLIPALQSGFMAKAGSSWRIATLRPGEDPTGHLAAALSARDVLGANTELASTNRVLLEATLHRGTLGLVDAVRQARIPRQDNVLIVVDQFEELFRFRQGRQFGNSRDEAVAFVKLLLEAAQAGEVPIYIVVTMRSDFIGECMEFPGLPEAVNNGQYLVPRMTRDELRSAITGPVAVGGAEITPRLVLRLLNEVGNDHDQLPVLQHALMRTWDHWQRHQQAGPIDAADYEAIGTLRQALSLHAEEAYLETGSEQGKQIAERMFKALTDTFSDPRGIRRPTSVKQLSAICEVSESEVIQIVEIFRRAGRSFLMPPAATSLDSRSIVDVSHESLMRCWTRLITWAEEERASARVYTRLSQASNWFEEGTAGLWHNPELELGVRWKQQNHPTEAWSERYNSSFARAMDFLDRSEKERDRMEAEREKDRKNKLRLAWAVASALGVLLLVALSFYYVARMETARAQTNLRLAWKAVDESLSSAGRQQGVEAAGSPQLEQFRQELLKKAEEFYSSFLAKQSRNDPEFRAESALLHSKLGDINRLLEKREDAVGQYKAAINGFEQLHQEKPGNAEYRRALAYAHNWLGETLRQWSEDPQSMPEKISDAEREYNSALPLQQDLHDELPQNADYQQELARTYYNRGILRFDRGDVKISESDFTEAIRLLEPLAKRELKSQTKEGENPPLHDLARVYNNLGNLVRSEGQLEKAQDLFERAIRIQKELVKKDPDNWEYRVELAIFYNNHAFFFLEKGDMEMAMQQNHAALDSIEDLASPSPLMETERAKAHMLHLFLGPSHHPDFHVLYKNLGREYVNLATGYFKAGSPDAARLAIQSLGRVLPEVAEPDRTTLEQSYRELQKQLQESKNKVK